VRRRDAAWSSLTRCGERPRMCPVWSALRTGCALGLRTRLMLREVAANYALNTLYRHRDADTAAHARN